MIMLRSILKLNKVSVSNIGNLRCAALLSTSVRCENVDIEEPNFLEMVTIFADNAHVLALDNFLSAPPKPGTKPGMDLARQQLIQGITFLFFLSLCIQLTLKLSIRATKTMEYCFIYIHWLPTV